MGEEPNENVGKPLDPDAVDRTSATGGLPSSGVGEGSQDVHALKADIEQTRAEIGETLQAIEERLSPSQIAQNAAHSVRDSASRKVGDMMSSASERASDLAGQTREAVRDNPMPAAMLGLGLGYAVYTMMRRRRPHASLRRRDEWTGYEADDSAEYGAMYGGSQDYGRSFMESIGSNPLPAALAAVGIGWMLRNVRRGAHQPMWSDREWETEYDASGGGYESGTVGGTVGSHTAGEWKESAKQMATSASHRVRKATRRTSQTVSQRSTQLARMFRENPVPFGIAALAAGAAIGLSVPETETENELMGEARDQMIERAREAKDSVVERAKAVTGMSGEKGSENAPGSMGSSQRS